ncbi:MAG: 5'-nucleotidase C-terminal domain-containing protein [Oscillospiraceae bacterium]|nr:5'-nucleotidase C-terminal domain-containing protein [Oscillospiraceae bacterium]MBQ9721436.1 5'-nucleotidase C-terminal domain-containing protein [Oscillospiraceae bacterium]
MKNIRKYLAFVLALVMSLSLSISASAYNVTAETKALTDIAADLTGKTVILHSNDVHGEIAGYAYIAALKTELAGRGAEVILADAGDFSQGDPNVSVSKGATAIEMMNAVGYDVVTLGNHEFDYGYAQLMDNLSKANFKAICADVLKDGASILDPTYVYETKSGVKIGFYGLETPETQTKVNPGLIQGITFLSNSAGKTELYDCAAKQVADLKAAGADIIVGLWHLGVDDESGVDGHRSVDVLAKASGTDLVIDGHSQTVMTAGANGEAVQSTGTKFANVGVVVIDDAAKTIESRFLISTTVKDADGNVTGELAKDETVAAAAAKIKADVDAKYGAVFAKSEVELNGEKAPGNRNMETNNGDLITEAMRWSVLKEDGAVTVDAANVVAITNGGGIRAAIKPGDVTMKDINTVLPFGNTIAVVYVTGAELLEALEASTYSTPGAIGGYPQTTGIKWTLDATKGYDANAETYPGSTYYGPKSINRVTIESVNGKVFDKSATYAVVTNNFCAAGGSTYYAFKAASAQFDTGIPLDEAVMAYVEQELKGVISTAYAAPRGDQTQILPAEAPAETPANAPAETPAAADDTYTVIAGDCLWSIAQKLLGSGKLWGQIYQLNKNQIKDPSMIYIGQVLKLR